MSQPDPRVEAAVARALSDSFHDDFDWDSVSPDGLSTRDAWALATAWHAQLKGHVGISTDESNGLFAVVPCYEWVDVWPGCGNRNDALVERRAVVARVASLVWRALAACRGFGASENPQFWKRLFSELAEEPTRYHEGYCDIHSSEIAQDEYRFFDGVVFPRFRLHLCRHHGEDMIVRVVRLFCGIDGAPDADCENLTEALQKLTPFVRQRPADPVELTIETDVVQMDDAFVNTLVDIIDGRRPCYIDDDGADEVRSLLYPTYTVPTLYFGYIAPWGLGTMDAVTYLEYGSDLEKTVANRRLSSKLCEVPAEDRLPFRLAFRDYLIRVLGIDGHSVGCLRHIMYEQGDDEHGLPAVFSAMPHTTTLETLGVVPIEPRVVTMYEEDAAWLGYALFHPDASASSWRRLHFDMLEFFCDDKPDERIAMMARGNNLMSALGLSDKSDLVDAYYTATIRAGTDIRQEPGDDQPIVETLDDATRMDVCVNTTDISALREWVFVVVAGFGNAWVCSRDIESIESRPPGGAFLTALKFSHCQFYDRFSSLFQYASEALEYVGMTGSISIAKIPLLKLVPSLRALEVSIKGDDLQDFVFPSNIRELSLDFIRWRSWSEPLRFMGSAVRDLKLLETLSVRTQPPTESSLADFVLPAFRSLPRLRRINWTDWLDSVYMSNISQELGFARMRFLARELFGALEPDDAMAVVGISPQMTVIGLLSVAEYLSRDDSESAVRALNRDLLTHILSFVERFAPRDLSLY